jgi:hypothetical protein
VAVLIGGGQTVGMVWNSIEIEGLAVILLIHSPKKMGSGGAARRAASNGTIKVFSHSLIIRTIFSTFLKIVLIKWWFFYDHWKELVELHQNM